MFEVVRGRPTSSTEPEVVACLNNVGILPVEW